MTISTEERAMIEAHISTRGVTRVMMGETGYAAWRWCDRTSRLVSTSPEPMAGARYAVKTGQKNAAAVQEAWDNGHRDPVEIARVAGLSPATVAKHCRAQGLGGEA